MCYDAWISNKNKYYSISNKKSYTIKEVARLFKSEIRYLKKDKGERYASALSSLSISNKVYKNFGKINLKDYIEEFIKNNS